MLGLSFKGTVPRDFRLHVFYMDQSPQADAKRCTLTCEYLREFSKKSKRSQWDSLGQGGN